MIMVKSPQRDGNASNVQEHSMTGSTDEICLCFQDMMKSYKEKEKSDNGDENDMVANVFFELANAPMVSYRIDFDHDESDETRKNKQSTSSLIRIYQDHKDACGQHTGGIVWETSFLLLNYLRQHQYWLQNDADNGSKHATSTKYPCGKTVVEVGAGCGLLGLGINHSHLAKRVILTETDSVLPNLQRNVGHNNNSTSNTNESTDSKFKIRVGALDWTRYQEDCHQSNIEPHSVDMIVGTDVVFSTRFVRPLLETLRYLAHSKTTILLCLQERCPDAHRLLLESSEDFGLVVENISEEVYDVPTCEWGRELECCVLRLQVLPEAVVSPRNSDAAPKKKKRRTVKISL